MGYVRGDRPPRTEKGHKTEMRSIGELCYMNWYVGDYNMNSYADDRTGTTENGFQIEIFFFVQYLASGLKYDCTSKNETFNFINHQQYITYKSSKFENNLSGSILIFSRNCMLLRYTRTIHHRILPRTILTS